MNALQAATCVITLLLTNTDDEIFLTFPDLPCPYPEERKALSVLFRAPRDRGLDYLECHFSRAPDRIVDTRILPDT